MNKNVPPRLGGISVFRAVRIFVIAAIITSLFAYLSFDTHALYYFEEALYGYRLQVAGLAHPEYADQVRKQITVVEIDDGTYTWAFPASKRLDHIPSKKIAKLVTRLTAFGAKVIALDMYFDTPDTGDKELAASIKKSGRVLIGCRDYDHPVHGNVVEMPEDIFLKAKCDVGHSQVLGTADAPEYDRIEPVVKSGGAWIPSFSVEAVRMARGISGLPLPDSAEAPTIPGLPIVINRSKWERAFNIRYLYGSPTSTNPLPQPNDCFTPLSLQGIVDSPPDDFDAYRKAISNSIVLVGDTRGGSGDTHETPVFNKMPGVLIQANAIATVLDGHYIRAASIPVQLLLLIALLGVVSALAAVLPLRSVTLLLILILPSAFVVNVWLFVQQNYYVHLAGPSGAILLTTLCVLLERGLSEESEKSRMGQLLRRYVNPRFASHILNNPNLIGGRGKRAVGTMLFSDIRGFTRLSETLSPEDLVARMNEYFQTITEIVFRHDGAAASIVGDAMLAVFGIPVLADNHADQAVAAAIEIQAAGKALREKWSDGDPMDLASGIGINTGEVIVGEVGGRQLRNFTVYGLHVNIASRVEALTKEYQSNILITRSTYEALKQKVEVGPPISVRVKGVAEAIDIFEVIEP